MNVCHTIGQNLNMRWPKKPHPDRNSFQLIFQENSDRTAFGGGRKVWAISGSYTAPNRLSIPADTNDKKPFIDKDHLTVAAIHAQNPVLSLAHAKFARLIWSHCDARTPCPKPKSRASLHGQCWHIVLSGQHILEKKFPKECRPRKIQVSFFVFFSLYGHKSQERLILFEVDLASSSLVSASYSRKDEICVLCICWRDSQNNYGEIWCLDAVNEKEVINMLRWHRSFMTEEEIQQYERKYMNHQE